MDRTVKMLQGLPHFSASCEYDISVPPLTSHCMLVPRRRLIRHHKGDLSADVATIGVQNHARTHSFRVNPYPEGETFNKNAQ